MRRRLNSNLLDAVLTDLQALARSMARTRAVDDRLSMTFVLAAKRAEAAGGETGPASSANASVSVSTPAPALPEADVDGGGQQTSPMAALLERGRRMSAKPEAFSANASAPASSADAEGSGGGLMKDAPAATAVRAAATTTTTQ